MPGINVRPYLENIYSIIKAIYGNPIINITLNEEKTEPISFKVRNGTLSTLIQHSCGMPSKRQKTERRAKDRKKK
jgi:hypothetical protein